jgi:hypothetical protein
MKGLSSGLYTKLRDKSCRKSGEQEGREALSLCEWKSIAQAPFYSKPNG